MAKLDLESFIGTEKINKIDERYLIVKYLYKDKTNHVFEVKFLDTKNVQSLTLNQIRNGTGLDLVQRKKLKRIKVELDLKIRNRLIKKSKDTEIIPNLDFKRCLGLDLATYTCGVAYAVNGQLKASKNIVADKTKNSYERTNFIVDEIVKIIVKGKVQTVILEGIYLGLNSSILIMLAELRGALIDKLVSLKVDWITVSANKWKNHYKDMPYTRDEQKEFSMKEFENIMKRVARTDDEADATLMLKAIIEQGRG